MCETETVNCGECGECEECRECEEKPKSKSKIIIQHAKNKDNWIKAAGYGRKALCVGMMIVRLGFMLAAV